MLLIADDRAAADHAIQNMDTRERLVPHMAAFLSSFLASVGACYFLLSSTGPLLQSWFNRNWPESSPYRLYTLSNLGSLLAIVSYPFIIEPNLGLDFQTKLWSYFYVLYAILCGACALKFMKNRFAKNTIPASPI